MVGESCSRWLALGILPLFAQRCSGPVLGSSRGDLAVRCKMIEWRTYSDSLLSVRLPVSLRRSPPGQWKNVAKGASARVFRGLVDEGYCAAHICVAIACDLTPSDIAVRKDMLVSVSALIPMPGERQHYAGPSLTRHGGVEIRKSYAAARQQGDGHYWMCAFPAVAERWVHLDVVCLPGMPLTWERFEAIGTEIIKSLQLAPGNPKRSARERPMGLGGRSRTRLEEALRGLPAALDYLRVPILSVADQDQLQLGCGEADLTKLTEALEQQGRLLGGFRHCGCQDARRVAVGRWPTIQYLDAASMVCAGLPERVRVRAERERMNRVVALVDPEGGRSRKKGAGKGQGSNSRVRCP